MLSMLRYHTFVPVTRILLVDGVHLETHMLHFLIGIRHHEKLKQQQKMWW